LIKICLDIITAIFLPSDGMGNVLGEPADIPQVGTFVSFTDTEGNRLSVLQALPREVRK
jgi:predicted enzyme related to lactoylglutathione lyase